MIFSSNPIKSNQTKGKYSFYTYLTVTEGGTAALRVIFSMEQSAPLRILREAGVK
jgi:hypothetical protein